MNNPNVFIPNVTDRIVEPKQYETYEEMIERLNHNHYAAVIQHAFRHYQFRQKVARWLAECMYVYLCYIVCNYTDAVRSLVCNNTRRLTAMAYEGNVF